MKTPDKAKRSHVLWAFRPLWIAAGFGAVVLAINYHHIHAPRTKLQVQVTIDGETPDQRVELSVDDLRRGWDEPVPIGFQTVQVRSTDTGPETFKRFIWYGVNDLGTVDLKRLHGSLVIRVEPKPDIFELHGKRGSQTNSTGVFTNLLAGEYRAVFRLGDLEEEADLRVVGNEETTVHRIAQIGALELSAQPSAGRFELLSKATGREWKGAFPSTFSQLKAGEYHLTAHNDIQRREFDLRILPNETNHLIVEYFRGEVEIVSDPPGAEVWLDTSQKGTTPLKLTALVPGQYSFEIDKAGFNSQFLNVTVAELTTVRTNVVLVSTRFRQSLESARKEQVSGNFSLAMQQVELALQERPADAEALRLKTAIQPGWFRQQAIRSQHSGDYDEALRLLAESRRLEPDQPELSQLEAEIRRWKVNHDALASPPNGTARQQQGATLFRESLKEEQVTESHATVIWNAGKPLANLLDGCNYIGRTFSKWNVSALVSNPGISFTCKMGDLDPATRSGSYARIGAIELEDGTAELRFMFFGISTSAQGSVPDRSPEHQRLGWIAFRSFLEGALVRK